MRTVYLGTSDFAGTVLRRLADSEHRPQLVVTRPDRPQGRGRKLQPPPVALVASELGLPLLQPESVNDEDARVAIAEQQPDVVCTCAYGALIKEPLLSDYALLNVHPSLLPRWRGAAPIERAMMAGDAETGVAIMRMVAELDAGAVCALGREPIRADDTYGSLAPRLADLAGDLLLQALGSKPEFVEQDETHVTYAEKITAQDRELRPQEQTAAELDRVVRALTSHIGARFRLGGESFLGVQKVRVVPAQELNVTVPPGEMEGLAGHLFLGCAERAVELIQVQPAGKQGMSGSDYLRGHTL